MKVYKSNYRNHWISPYHVAEKLCFWREIDYDEPWVQRLNSILSPVATALRATLDFVHPRINYVKIDEYDTWGMDHALADIILPMLKQLKESKHGAPCVEDKDVPKELRSTSAPDKENTWDIDDNHFLRWDWVLDEMIWAFEQHNNDAAEDQFYDRSAYKDIDLSDWFDDMTKGQSKVIFDQKGYTLWQKRKTNGFRLFGTYYQGLWD